MASRTGKRFGINTTGIQGINCNSAIYFNHRNNAVNFSINLCEYSISRYKNPIIIKKVLKAMNDPALDETTIKLKFLLPIITKKEHEALIDENDNINFKKLKNLCKKYKINYYKINKVRKEILIKKFIGQKINEND